MSGMSYSFLVYFFYNYLLGYYLFDFINNCFFKKSHTFIFYFKAVLLNINVLLCFFGH